MSRFKQIKDPSHNPELEAVYKEGLEAGFVGTEEGVPVRSDASGIPVDGEEKS